MIDWSIAIHCIISYSRIKICNGAFGSLAKAWVALMITVLMGCPAAGKNDMDAKKQSG
jgi:hypothetical protein